METQHALPIAPLGAKLAAVLDDVGDLMAFWGFQRSHGRIWALLYFAERPLHAAEIADILALSAGQVSMAVRELERWGVVHGERKEGERRTRFFAETNLFRMVTRVFRERELERIRALTRTLLAAREEMRGDAALGQKRQHPQSRLRRLDQLLAAAELGRELVTRLTSGKLLPQWVHVALDRNLDN